MIEKNDKLRDRLAEYNPDMLFADGYDDAIIGVGERCGQPVVCIYDAWKCVEILIRRDGMDPEEAMDFFQFNTLGAWVGENTPMYMWTRQNIEDPPHGEAA